MNAVDTRVTPLCAITGISFTVYVDRARHHGWKATSYAEILEVRAVISAPEVLQTDVQEAAVIHLTVPRREMMRVFGPAVGELMAALAAQGIAPAGAVFAHHLKMSPDTFDFELGVRVSAAVKAAGRVKPGQLPAAKVARTMYSGPYEGLPDAWAEFTAWMKANGHKQAEDLWEVYSVGPQSSPDPTHWRTELNRPLAS